MRSLDEQVTMPLGVEQITSSCPVTVHHQALRSFPPVGFRGRSASFQHEVVRRGQMAPRQSRGCAFIIRQRASAPAAAPESTPKQFEFRDASVFVFFRASGSRHGEFGRHQARDHMLISQMLVGRVLWDWTRRCRDTPHTRCNCVRGRHQSSGPEGAREPR